MRLHESAEMYLETIYLLINASSHVDMRHHGHFG